MRFRSRHESFRVGLAGSRFLLVALSFLIVGCVASSINIPKDAGDEKFKNMQVIAMEPPPLKVPPRFPLRVLGPMYPLQVAQGAMVASGILFLVQAPEAAKRGGAVSKSLEKLLSKREMWVPTMILAEEAATFLSAQGKRQVRVEPGVKTIPGIEKRDYTLLMENWYAPIRAWYNATEAPGIEKESAADQADVVVEIGILNYEITGDKLLLAVMVKVIDPGSGKVIGRDRASTLVTLAPFKELFAEEGKLFKETFTATGRELTRKCLRNIGLI